VAEEEESVRDPSNPTPLQKEYWAVACERTTAASVKINEFLKDFRAKGLVEQLGDNVSEQEGLRKEGIRSISKPSRKHYIRE
jgi:hypothetical protein